jgi:hypothetical protein
MNHDSKRNPPKPCPPQYHVEASISYESENYLVGILEVLTMQAMGTSNFLKTFPRPGLVGWIIHKGGLFSQPQEPLVVFF